MRLSYVHAVAEVTSLPGSSQVAVIHSALVDPRHRGEGFGTAAHKMRLEELRNTFLYDAAICTTDAANEAEIAILRKHGWQEATRFVSRKTEHVVIIWVRLLEGI